MDTWLVPAGLILYALGAFVQIAQEWRARGLTDTSYPVLLLLAAGPGCLAYAAVDGHARLLVIAATVAPAVLALGLVALKLRDRLRTLRLLP